MASTSGGGGGGGEPKSSDQVPGGGGGSSEVAVASTGSVAPPSRYESQKRRDWNTFLQYLKNHKPPLSLARCSGAHVIEFLKYLDQFGKTKVHLNGCTYFGHPNPPAPCACPLKQAWGSLDALIGRLRAAYEENGGRPESNPFGARAVRIYLREVREGQAKARGIPYEKKKRKRPPTSTTNNTTTAPTATVLPNATTSTVAVAAAQVVIDGDQGAGGGGDEVVTVAHSTAPTTSTTATS
ncbi:hypothetical protein C5167_002293 [Papaver somniferum]|uniref:ALOG domain-containing protein n=1 Tax=Papaver somniferum TaxID=3469 RepID=A0A4Y7L178_PAPSO|nr:protein LIGHT-DEPENDENT SHORT HYPOCOTYLS 5-like [Papaver somniferum]RZC78101.1 hypothetical protein C5167_002293 [Papaver somniferum]